MRDRVRIAVKAVLDQVELNEHIGALHREKIDSTTGERNVSFSSNRITPVSKIK